MQVTGALVLCNEEDFLLGRIVKDLAGTSRYTRQSS